MALRLSHYWVHSNWSHAAFIIFFTGNAEVLNLNVWTDPNGKGAQLAAIVAFVALLSYFVWESYKAKEED